ncbi:uncharacterized protein LOC107263527 [Cephus cinctus]|uniref:Uncharacterized protein LOC107263527 n=1 Tax=Cephus cinctus TaxID=211228 RepID=A0AAJ7FDF5_CEPCN|nr:uncharacterized protein LOC107263527 [Cephus cinctus]
MTSKKKSNKLSNATDNTATVVWTKAEKCALLKSLKKYGHKDISKIAETIPSKSQSDIKILIDKFTKQARCKKHIKTESPIDNWLASGMFPDTDTLIPEALLFIQLYEKHPPEEQTGGCNLREVYNFLYRMVLGQPTVGISPEVEKTVYYLISNITREVWPASRTEILNEIAKLPAKQKCLKVYPGKKMYF